MEAIMTTLTRLPSFIGFDRFFDDFERAATARSNSHNHYDVVHVSDNNYEIRVALAGYKKEGISVELLEDSLTVTAEGETGEGLSFLHRGLTHRKFTKTFKLSPEMKVVDGEFTDGLLVIRLQEDKPEAPKPLMIDVK
jgi:molecular chaperone IbpA